MTDLSAAGAGTFVYRYRTSLGWLLLGAALLFYLLTLRSGQRAGDFAMYVQHTANMAEGRPYAETGYFQNPASTSVGTKNYPPGLPVLLLPIYLVAGFHVTAMKILMIVLFFAALSIFWRLTRDEMALGFSLVMLLDIAFAPYLWSYKDDIASEFPFLLPLYLSLWLIQLTPARGGRVGQWLLIGVVMYAAVAIRPIGLVLPMTLLLYDLVEGKRMAPGARFWVPTAMLVALMVVQSVLLPLESGSYSSAFVQQVASPLDLIDSMVLNAKYYILACAGRLLLTNGHDTLWADVLLVASLGPFFFGLFKRLRTRIGVLEIFFAVYTGILLVWPFRQPSYLIPVMPFLSYYVFVGLGQLATSLVPKFKTAVAVLATGILAATFGMNYATMNFTNVAHNVMSPASMEFYNRIRWDTPPDAVILSRIPREIAFFTGRRSTPPNLPDENRDHYSAEEIVELLDYMEEVGVDFVAAGPKGPRFHREVLPLWDLTEQRDSLFVPLFWNSEWRLYARDRELPSWTSGVRSPWSEVRPVP